MFTLAHGTPRAGVASRTRPSPETKSALSSAMKRTAYHHFYTRNKDLQIPLGAGFSFHALSRNWFLAEIKGERGDKKKKNAKGEE